MSIDARMAALVEQGARRFDPDGLRLIERLVAAGLLERANLRLDKLERELDETRCDAEALVGEVARLSGRVDPAMTHAMTSGDYRVARRLARAAIREQRSSERSAVPRWTLAIADKAKARAVRLPQDLALRLNAFAGGRGSSLVGHGEMRALCADVSRALFDDSIASTRATIALARATDHVPESAGPYNTHALAAQALGALATLSPDYLRAYLATLDDLAAIESLAAVDTKNGILPRKRRGQ